MAALVRTAPRKGGEPFLLRRRLPRQASGNRVTSVGWEIDPSGVTANIIARWIRHRACGEGGSERPSIAVGRRSLQISRLWSQGDRIFGWPALNEKNAGSLSTVAPARRRRAFSPLNLGPLNSHTRAVTPASPQRRIPAVVFLAVQAAIWVVLMLVFAVLTQVAGFSSWQEALTFSATNWLPWMVLGPVVFWLGRRFPFERGRLWRAIPVHVVACAACCFVLLWTSAYFAPWPRGGRLPPGDARPPWERREPPAVADGTTLERSFRDRRERPRLERLEEGSSSVAADTDVSSPPTPRSDRKVVERMSKDGRSGFRGIASGPGGMRPGFMGLVWPHYSAVVLRVNVGAAVYLIIASVAHAFSYYRRAQQRETEAIALTAGLARAKLDALRLQLQPHFLFNTLNAISTLVHRDPAAADELIGDLSELLRLSLQTADHEVPLARELELLDCYLAIEQIRLGDRLRIVREIDPHARAALVPTFVLQPLAENAIRHGIEPRLAPGTLTIRAEMADGHLRLVVSDDGVGLKSTGAASGRRGIGIANTEQRLHALHGDAARLELTAPEAGGVRVEIVLPVRTTPSPLPVSA